MSPTTLQKLRLRSPVMYFVSILLLVFVAEVGVMFLLPLFLPPDVNANFEAICDASILTVIVAPMLWSLLIQPLRMIANDQSTKYAALVNDAQDAILTIDAKHRIDFVNPAGLKLLGYEFSEIVGLTPVTVLPEIFADRLGIEGQINCSKVKETIAISKDLKAITVDLTISAPKLRSTGRFSLILRDASDRKLAQVQNELAQKEKIESARYAGKAEIATSILHNVGNTLTCINVLSNKIVDDARDFRVGGLVKAAELIESNQEDLGTFFTKDKRGLQLPSYLSKVAEELSENQIALVQELEQLIEYLHHANRIVSAQQEFARCRGVEEEVNIADIIGNAIDISSASLERHGVEISHDVDIPYKVMLDRHKLIQIIVNLLTNAKDAVKHRPEYDRTVSIRALIGDSDRLRIEVTDNGLGIDPANLSKIFSQGFTTKTNGHGFGLHYCATAVMEMNGNLSVQSRGLNQGATFIMDVPCKVLVDEVTI